MEEHLGQAGQLPIEQGRGRGRGSGAFGPGFRGRACPLRGTVDRRKKKKKKRQNKTVESFVTQKDSYLGGEENIGCC